MRKLIGWRRWGRTPLLWTGALCSTRRWVIDSHFKHWIALNSCRQSKLYQIPLESAKKTAQNSGFSYHGVTSPQDRTGNKFCLCILPIGRGNGTSLCVCLSDPCNIENTHFWQARNECVGKIGRLETNL
jgi:hypothetical protein